MNRISFLFAVMVGVSFAVLSTPSGSVSPESPTALSANRHAPMTTDDITQPARFISNEAETFLDEFRKRERDRGISQVNVLFATLPDPIETDLAAMFDHNVAALQDGVEDSGYLFDSSWIPWDDGRTYENLADDLLAAQIRDMLHDYPGILLFRGSSAGKDPVDSGKANAAPNADLLVFLLTEKPTAGIAVNEAESAMTLLAKSGISLVPEIEFLGPSFSGSLSSMTAVLRILTKPIRHSAETPERALIRSGSVTSYEAAKALLERLQEELPRLQVDLGSAEHRYDDLLDLALHYLEMSGARPQEVAVLTENESQFGRTAMRSRARWGLAWNVLFPRDISTLRARYEEQRVLETSLDTNTLKRYLHLTESDERGGDSVRTMGGQDTLMSKESVLFGITGFLRSHHICAVIIVATSEADRYFLTRFLHANNPGMRVIVLGSTRLFMRGSTNQFRGDMMVSDFPMLARLHDWTATGGVGSDYSAHIFPDDTSQGTYIAARDLLTPQPACSSGADVPPEYSGLPWGEDSRDPNLKCAPPVYISALGGDSAWPVWTTSGNFLKDPDGATYSSLAGSPPTAKTPAHCQVTIAGVITGHPAHRTQAMMSSSSAPPVSDLVMPFQFGRHFDSPVTPGRQGTCKRDALIHTGHLWKALLWTLWGLAGLYVVAVFYANPVVRQKFVYLHPTDEWRYWLFALALPALIIGFGFLVLAWAHRFPSGALQSSWDQFYWIIAIFSSVLIPFLLAVVCAIKAKTTGFLKRPLNLIIAFAPVAILGFVAVSALQWQRGHHFATGEIMAIYREMYWESGLSLVPSALLLLFALMIWAYFAAVGTSLLRSTWLLPQFLYKGRISRKRGIQIIQAARPVPMRAGSKWYWILATCSIFAIFFICRFWPSISDITSLEISVWTHRMLWLGFVVTAFMLLDLIQFAWLWAELRDLLMALDREHFRRSFVPLRENGWGSLWSFSAGSFQDLRNRLAEQIDSLHELGRDWNLPNLRAALEPFELRRRKYSRSVLGRIPVNTYYQDLDQAFQDLSDMGTAVSWLYLDYIKRPTPVKSGTLQAVNCYEDAKDRFREEKTAVDQLPDYERLVERFLCLSYIGFIQTVIARLRGLAFSFVSMFSLIALSITVYPFQPIQTLLGCGLSMFALIAGTSIVVYSQMDKDPVLSRVLNGAPTRLEGSFYGKLIETLTPPLLALLTSLLPGGAGRLIDVVGKLFGSPH